MGRVHPQGDMHMVAARLGCKSAMVGTGWANPHPGSMDRLRKCHSLLVGGSFLAGKAAWALSRCLTTESAEYCMHVNGWAVAGNPVLSRSTNLESKLIDFLFS